MLWLLLLNLTVWVTAATPNRTISWWFDVSESDNDDQANLQTITEHPNVFSRVMPITAKVELDGNASNWWGHDEDVARWNAPLQALEIPVLPYLIDIDNATQMHMVYANSTAFIDDAVAIAVHYNFQGWFIDYEDEYPPDTSANKSQALAAFLTELGNKLHAKGMQLCICVASWSSLLSDYKTLAASPGVDELQLMSTYANPSNSKAMVESYFEKIKAGAGNLEKAGVGIGIYYDGRNGYAKDWTNSSAREFVENVVSLGGGGLDIFRLMKGKDDWPHDEFWWGIFEDFISGQIV